MPYACSEVWIWKITSAHFRLTQIWLIIYLRIRRRLCGRIRILIKTGIWKQNNICRRKTLGMIKILLIPVQKRCNLGLLSVFESYGLFISGIMLLLKDNWLKGNCWKSSTKEMVLIIKKIMVLQNGTCCHKHIMKQMTLKLDLIFLLLGIFIVN